MLLMTLLLRFLLVWGSLNYMANRNDLLKWQCQTLNIWMTLLCCQFARTLNQCKSWGIHGLVSHNIWTAVCCLWAFPSWSFCWAFSRQLCTFVGPSLLHFYCIMVGGYLLHLLLWSELDADFSITVMIFSSKLEIVINPNSVHLPGFAVSLHRHHSAVVFSYLDWLAFSWQQVSCVRVIGKSVSHMNGCIKWDLSFLWLDEQGWWRACHGWSIGLFHLMIVSYHQQLRLVTELLGLKSQLLEYLGWLKMIFMLTFFFKNFKKLSTCIIMRFVLS